MVDPFREYLIVGFVQRAHGLKGEVILDLQFQLKDPDHFVVEVDGSRIPFEVEEYTPVDKKAYVKLSGVGSLSDTELIKGRKVFSHERFIPQEEVLSQRLIAYEVIDEIAGKLGTVTSISNMARQRLMHINTGEGADELLVPYHEDIVKSIDHVGSKIFLRLPAGFLE